VAYLATVEALAPEGETLSEAVDTWIERHPGRAVWYILVAAVGGHLLNLIPEPIDPLHRAFTAAKQRKKAATHRDKIN